MRSLPSKLVAGGLSAGVVLLWWPHVFGRDDELSWVLRGICWTLIFELLVICLRPLETALWAHIEQRRAARRLVALGARLAPRSPRRHLAAVAVLAAVAFSLPLALILEGEPATADKPGPPQITEVKKVVRVVRPVEVERVVVREVVPARATTRPSGPAPTPTATAASPAASAAGKAGIPGRRAASAPASRAPTARSVPAGPEKSATTEPATAEATPEAAPSPAPAPARPTPARPTPPDRTTPVPAPPTPPASSPAPGPAPGPR